MNLLTGLQQEFQHAVLARAPTPSLFAREPATGGFDIYLNAYRARLTEALRDNYPVLRLALGDDLFDALANAYITQHPSRFRSIRWFGDRLAEFMDAHPELTSHASLPDLARMDWALRQSFDADDDGQLAVSDLAALAAETWPSQHFRLRAAAALVELHWGIEPVWQALNKDAAAETAPPEPFNHTLLVWRDILECKWRSLGQAEAAGLTALRAGRSFADIGAGMMAVDGAITPTVAAMLLRQWVEEGLLAK